MSTHPNVRIVTAAGGKRPSPDKTSTGVTAPRYMWKAVCDPARDHAKGEWTQFIIDPGVDGCGLGTAKQKKDGLAPSGVGLDPKVAIIPFPGQGCGTKLEWSEFFAKK